VEKMGKWGGRGEGKQMSLDKRIAISEESYGVSEEMKTNMIFVIRIYY